MKRIIIILTLAVWVHGNAMAQSSDDLSGKKKKDQNYLAKETDKVIEGRSGRRKNNAKSHDQKRQSANSTNKKKSKKRTKKTANFGFY